MIKEKEIEQGSPEWFSAKAGMPSASSFDKIVTTKGVASTSAKKYMYQLAGESITGTKEDSYQSPAMTRGIEMEAEAREMYEFIKEVKVETVGMCYKDEKKLFLCSPDGLVGDDGGLEIKCPTMAVHVEYLLDQKMPTKYFQQVQGSMFVTSRKWWDFMSYYPGMKPFIIRVERNEGFIRLLEKELKELCVGLETTINKIK